MININRQLALTMLAASAISFSATAEEETSISEQDWGIAAVYRMASIPFYTGNNDQTVGTIVPMMYFENEHVFVEGLQGGAYLYKPEDEDFQLSALMRLRFVDIPSSEQNSNGGDAVDFGGQLRYFLDDDWYLDAELMTDDEFRFHSNLSISGEFEYGDWELKPHARLRYKDADFNSQYYTFSDVTKEKVGGGVDLNVGIDARYHVYSNLYLLGSTSVTRLDNNAYHSSTVEDRYQGEFYIGFGFFNDKSKAPKSELKNKRYFRIAHGWATPSNIGDIMKLNTEKDPYNNQMTSFFYGHPLTDELFGVPLDIYFTPGIVHHWSSDVQSASTEYVAAIKAYYTFNWPTQWRFGVAEGMSFIDSITYIEQTEMDSKGYNASNLLNYLDFSFDINVGDLINNRDLDNMWVGYSLHHRSAIFEQASQYGRIKGGSNYNTIYVQFDF
ncbi:MipA/OmpV family protein [Vibrio coralliilyticus]|uniref:MltA-interacting MipA family protein n=2 Tax=Vibrio coralliilyticus TaxID=190893 RepID=A0AAN0SA44_9VIBR|nr:MltA-interacting MipA family protein [Vibrio coralliilyticus]NOH38416.1 MipA/OmpV family protein [Vibrio coralliilyticus]